jgi:hypothetical protein
MMGRQEIIVLGEGPVDGCDPRGQLGFFGPLHRHQNRAAGSPESIALDCFLSSFSPGDHRLVLKHEASTAQTLPHARDMSLVMR